jgi:hypothetical protein
LFPSEIKLYHSKRVPVTLTNIEVVQKPLAADLFVPAPGSTDLERCEDMKPPQAISTPEPLLSAKAERLRKAIGIGRVRMTALVDKKGKVATLKVLNQEDPDVASDTIRAVRGWRFKPATCSGHPVNVWMTLEVDYR